MSSTTPHRFGKRTALILTAGTLVCALGVGIAIAADNAEAPANGSSDVVAYHDSLGISFEDLADNSTEDKTAEEISAGTVGTREFCLSCHDWDAIVDSTLLSGDVTVYNKQGLYNVHDNHNGLVDCSDCHSIGETSTLGCVSCHYMDLPEGWEGFY